MAAVTAMVAVFKEDRLATAASRVDVVEVSRGALVGARSSHGGVAEFYK
jgi:hypothetical protein